MQRPLVPFRTRGCFSIIAHAGAAHLQLQFVGDKGDELRIGGLALGVGNRVAEEALEGIQISSVPCYFNSMANGSFHSAGCGLECFRHLRIEHLGDGINLPDGKQRANILVGVFGDLLLYSLVYKQPVYWSNEMIANTNFSVKLETYEYLKI